MRTLIAEGFADALGMRLHLGTAKVSGGMTVFISMGGKFKMPIQLNVIGHFDSGIEKDAGLLLKGPGNLLGFLGYEDATTEKHFALIDAAALGDEKAIDILRLGGGTDVVVAMFEKRGAVKGYWRQKSRHALWAPAGTNDTEIPF